MAFLMSVVNGFGFGAGFILAVAFFRVALKMNLLN